MILTDGRYSVVYASGDYRTVRVRTVADGGLAGQWHGIGFLNENNQIKFWRRFINQNPPERLPRIQRAVTVIASDPEAAQQAYGMREKKCARCGRQLTVPASIHHGLGPECAGKVRWKKADHQMVFEVKRSQVV